MNTPILFRTGKNIALRLITEEDAEQMYRWINDPEIVQYLDQDFPISLGKEVEWVQSIQDSKENVILGIHLIETGTLIGIIGLHRINTVDRTATMGIYIGDKNHWGKEYGVEAGLLQLHYAFDTLNLRKICACAYSFNSRSIGFQQKCGYKVEGARKKQCFRNGKYWDEVQLAVFRKDWLPIWERYQEKTKG